MGVRGLLSYVKKRVPLLNPLNSESEPLTIGVDTHGLLYIWQEDIQAFTKFLEAFTQFGHTLLCVFDGEASIEKKEYLQQRRNRREQANIQAKALESFLQTEEGLTLDERSRAHLEKEILTLRSSMWHITKEYRQQILNELEKRNIQYNLAKGEADDVLVELSKTNKIDVILSSDMDFVRFGVNRIWIPSFRQENYMCYDFDIPIFCDSEDILIENLKEVAELCGSELVKASKSPSEAFGILRYYGSLENYRRRVPNEK